MCVTLPGAGGEGSLHPEPSHSQHKPRSIHTDHPTSEAGELLMS